MRTAAGAACLLLALAQPASALPNPASVYCVSLGGRLEIRTGPTGEVGFCHLPDGRVVEEWALFRASRADAGPTDATQPVQPRP